MPDKAPELPPTLPPSSSWSGGRGRQWTDEGSREGALPQWRSAEGLGSPGGGARPSAGSQGKVPWILRPGFKS